MLQILFSGLNVYAVKTPRLRLRIVRGVLIVGSVIPFFEVHPPVLHRLIQCFVKISTMPSIHKCDAS